MKIKYYLQGKYYRFSVLNNLSDIFSWLLLQCVSFFKYVLFIDDYITILILDLKQKPDER